MKLKSYLRGLGLGMVVTTIILVVTFKAANHEMTDDEIISKARELGMVETSLYANNSITEEFTVENATTQSTEQETTTGEKSGEGMLEQETTGKPETTTAANKPESTTTASQQETTAKREETTTGKKEETTTDSNEIVLVFENISSADKASRILYDAGIIQDVDSFNDFLSDNGYARKITEGTFTFKKGMSFEEIAKVITRSR